MKERIVQKKDIVFVVALALFSAVCMLRFFDHNLYERKFVFEIMNNYYFVWIVNVIMQGIFVLLSLLSLSIVEEEKKKSLIFFLAFFSVFICSMFWNENYFGASDTYVYLMAFVSIVLFVLEKGMFIIPIFAFLSAFISPVCALSVFLSLFLAMFVFGKKKVFVIDIISFIMAILGFVMAYVLGYIDFDIRINLSVKQVVIILVMFIPYYVLGVMYFIKVRKNKKYVVALLMGMIAPVIEFLLRDCSRAIFYAFTYYILLIMILLIKREETTCLVISEMGDIIRKYLRWPAIVIAYAFVVITIWISGPLTLFEETFVGL